MHQLSIFEHWLRNSVISTPMRLRMARGQVQEDEVRRLAGEVRRLLRDHFRPARRVRIARRNRGSPQVLDYQAANQKQAASTPKLRVR